MQCDILNMYKQLGSFFKIGLLRLVEKLRQQAHFFTKLFNKLTSVARKTFPLLLFNTPLAVRIPCLLRVCE